jgi:hypothetical protein
MTSGAAVIAVVLALMVGSYWARWRRAEGSAKSARAMADGAGKAVWRARGSMLLVGVAVYVAVALWFRGLGRLSGTRVFRHPRTRAISRAFR